MLRRLKLLVLPLVSISITSGVCSLRRGGAGSDGGAAGDVGRLARYAFAYYAACTAGAIALGLLLVTSIRPGRGAPFDALAAGGGCGGAAEAPAFEQAGTGESARAGRAVCGAAAGTPARSCCTASERARASAPPRPDPPPPR
jgi:hypothetical protein